MATPRVREGTASDYNVPNACATCDGPLAVRISNQGARGYCKTCHALTAPAVSVENGVISLSHLVEPN